MSNSSSTMTYFQHVISCTLHWPHKKMLELDVWLCLSLYFCHNQSCFSFDLKHQISAREHFIQSHSWTLTWHGCFLFLYFLVLVFQQWQQNREDGPRQFAVWIWSETLHVQTEHLCLCPGWDRGGEEWACYPDQKECVYRAVSAWRQMASSPLQQRRHEGHVCGSVFSWPSH